ncbi:hypothetical protein HGM15179_000705 [Zosterops borbonicus]|uniref:Uncharacterized protein n=1 Tax=Zosterops borbonicus TaxID=364589 RepID=A0A8K1GYS9_9PASS|nr:hypothetical protein HGM15179_000705 [Zosterops borbonicus]
MVNSWSIDLEPLKNILGHDLFQTTAPEMQSICTQVCGSAAVISVGPRDTKTVLQQRDITHVGRVAMLPYRYDSSAIAELSHQYGPVVRYLQFLNHSCTESSTKHATATADTPASGAGCWRDIVQQLK